MAALRRYVDELNADLGVLPTRGPCSKYDLPEEGLKVWPSPQASHAATFVPIAASLELALVNPWSCLRCSPQNLVCLQNARPCQTAYLRDICIHSSIAYLED